MRQRRPAPGSCGLTPWPRPCRLCARPAQRCLPYRPARQTACQPMGQARISAPPALQDRPGSIRQDHRSSAYRSLRTLPRRPRRIERRPPVPDRHQRRCPLPCWHSRKGPRSPPPSRTWLPRHRPPWHRPPLSQPLRRHQRLFRRRSGRRWCRRQRPSRHRGRPSHRFLLLSSLIAGPANWRAAWWLHRSACRRLRYRRLPGRGRRSPWCQARGRGLERRSCPSRPGRPRPPRHPQHWPPPRTGYRPGPASPGPACRSESRLHRRPSPAACRGRH